MRSAWGRLVVAFWLLWPQAGSAADAEQLARGEQVLRIGGCAHCHTAKEGPALAGGDALVTPFGTFYAPNITPSKTTGIGGWSEADFAKAMREGLSPKGDPYYPAFPFTSYTRMTDEDLKDLKAYLDSVPAVEQASRPHELGFPFNQRWGLHAWRLAFFTPGRFTPDPARSREWNRGAYLAESLGHCQECHTPRTFYGVLEKDRAYAGATLGKEKIPNLTTDKKAGLGDWTKGDVKGLLSMGMTPDGDFVGGEMAKIVEHGTGKLPAADLDALVEYLISLPPKQ